MSAAIAPPTVTCRVPGTTATIQPWPSVRRASPSSETPAPTSTSPDAGSIGPIPVRPAPRPPRPPAFCAASPYARPRPRASTPRGPASATSAATAPGSAGSCTSARVGAGRPPPLSSPSPPPGVDANGEEREPAPREDAQLGVAEDEVLRRPAVPPLDEQAVAQQEQREGHDRQLGPRPVRPVAAGERPAAVRHQRDRGGDSAQLTEERLGIGGEGPALLASVDRRELHALARALRGDDEERPGRDDDEEPPRQRHVGGHAAADHADHEQRRHGGEVEQLPLAEVGAVDAGQDRVAEHGDADQDVDREAEADAGH